MILRLTVVTTLIAVFALSMSALVDSSRQRSFAAPSQEGGNQGCLTAGLLCAPSNQIPN
ncbi:hypothetical protein GCM10011390_09880 [Aureimonas endophytica]|uniref:Uncharacterized protein n=1 Tax=Aureimonas endophytica TaxID=2027858 RepID=A0A917E1Q0_9HYPH|nr:hypothetical protein [Aureimonas endophytica]GGD93149.1 hypothetical protein GCM10011390_09880 [Aureimonas endophytica]